jgi:hypothetical protein
MEKLNRDLFRNDRLNNSILSNIVGGTTFTSCASSTCDNSSGNSDTRTINTDDNGSVTSDTTVAHQK